MLLLDRLCQLAKLVEDGARIESWDDRNETETRRDLIDEFIAVLGYQIGRASRDVRQEVQLRSGQVDYELRRNGQPIMLIEAKKATTSLSEHRKQLGRYFGDSPAQVAILTNGRSYEIFTNLGAAKTMDRDPILEFDLRWDFRSGNNEDKKLADSLTWFMKNRFSPQCILSFARRNKMLSVLKRELRAPSKKTAQMFANLVTGEEIDDPNLIDNYSAALAEAASELFKTAIISDVVQLEIIASYRGRRFDATLLLTEPLEQNGENVVFRDRAMNHQVAAMEAARSVDPNLRHVSGSEFWKYIDPDTIEELPIKRLFFDYETRKRVRNRGHRL